MDGILVVFNTENVFNTVSSVDLSCMSNKIVSINSGMYVVFLEGKSKLYFIDID